MQAMAGAGNGGAGGDPDVDPLVYILQPTKVTDMAQLTAALDEWGISHGYELLLLDEEGLGRVAGLRPVRGRSSCRRWLPCASAREQEN